MHITPFQAKITATSMLSPGVKHFIATVISNDAFSFIPGQFITIHFENNNIISIDGSLLFSNYLLNRFSFSNNKLYA